MNTVRTHEQFLSDLQPIIDRIAGSNGGPMLYSAARESASAAVQASYDAARAAASASNVFYGGNDNLPNGCDGCREDIGGKLICCVNQQDED